MPIENPVVQPIDQREGLPFPSSSAFIFEAVTLGANFTVAPILYVGTAGDVVAVQSNGTTVTLPLSQGYHPAGSFTKIETSGTTAAGLFLLRPLT